MIAIEVTAAALVTLLASLSCLGWGALVRSWIAPRARSEPGLVAAWGMAFLAVSGGVFSLLGAAGAPLLRSCGILGVVLGAWWADRYRRALPAGAGLRAPSRWARVAAVSLGAAICLRLLAAAFQELNAHDDFHAYLVFPIRMMATGGLASEPFSERRLLVLGGQPFLQALQLTWLPWRFANLTDLGLGWLILMGLVGGHMVERGVLPAAALLVLLALQYERPPVVNLSSTVTAAALQYALLRTWCLEPPVGRRLRVAMLAWTIAGLCSLKSSLVVGVVAGLASLWLGTEREERRGRLVEAALASLAAGLLLLPWMVQLHASSGTWFYPLLGRGFHGSTYGNFPGVSAHIRANAMAGALPAFLARSRGLVALGIVPLVCLPLVQARLRRVRQLALVWAAAWAAAFAIYLESGGLDRYGYPILLASTLFVLVECLPRSDEARAPARSWRVATAALLALLVPVKWSQGPSPFAPLGTRLDRSAEGERVDYLNGQAIVPPGAQILACAAYPFLFDFRRNPIYTVDHAGGASPPPGMPVMGTTDALTSYLRQRSIRYVIYSYADEAAYGRSAVADRLALRGGFYAERTRKLAEYNIAFRDHLSQLARGGAKVYENARVLVLDLEAPSALRPADSRGTPRPGLATDSARKDPKTSSLPGLP